MKTFSRFVILSFVVLLALLSFSALAAEPAAKPVLKITPGKVIVPTDKMRRPWGELVSMDLATRTGTFRKEGSDEVIKFIVMPYAELLHHATFGDLEDFRVGERAIFRLHENEAGEWIYLTYIQDEMNFLKNHGEQYQVDSIDPKIGTFTVTQGNWDPKLKEPFIRTKGIVIGTDADTHYWKNGEPAKFTDIKVGDRLRTKTHGIGKGSDRVCWEVFLDDESLLKFQAEQKAVHTSRLAKLGLPGYIDDGKAKGSEDTAGRSAFDMKVDMTLFQEGGDVLRSLKKGQKVRFVLCGVDRLPTGKSAEGVVADAKMLGNLGKVSIAFSDPAAGDLTLDIKVGGVARIQLLKLAAAARSIAAANMARSLPRRIPLNIDRSVGDAMQVVSRNDYAVRRERFGMTLAFKQCRHKLRLPKTARRRFRHESPRLPAMADAPNTVPTGIPFRRIESTAFNHVSSASGENRCGKTDGI
ncbi:MAG: hypothetical protein K8U03_25650 [Planctomycetia bacterium]|nr:hypothetical protein [Planctomycetia bacterium]